MQFTVVLEETVRRESELYVLGDPVVCKIGMLLQVISCVGSFSACVNEGLSQYDPGC